MFDGKKIREKREALGLSAEELVKKLKLSSRHNLYKYEKRGSKPRDEHDFLTLKEWLGEKVKKSNGSVPHEDYKEKYYTLLEKYTALLEKK